jgi:hypothetical protein
MSGWRSACELSAVFSAETILPGRRYGRQQESLYE